MIVTWFNNDHDNIQYVYELTSDFLTLTPNENKQLDLFDMTSYPTGSIFIVNASIHFVISTLYNQKMPAGEYSASYAWNDRLYDNYGSFGNCILIQDVNNDKGFGKVVRLSRAVLTNRKNDAVRNLVVSAFYNGAATNVKVKLYGAVLRIK